MDWGEQLHLIIGATFICNSHRLVTGLFMTGVVAQTKRKPTPPRRGVGSEEPSTKILSAFSSI